MAEIMCAYAELKPLHKLQPHPENPHKHSQEQIDRLAKLIDYQGIRHPVIVSKRSGFIVAGHGRLAALKKLGVSDVPIDYQDFEDEAQEYAFIVSDNAIGKDEWAALDVELIQKKIDIVPIQIPMLGIKDFEIKKLDPQSDEDEVPETPAEPVSKLGDMYEFGSHRLLCGDSTSIDAVEKLMNGDKAALVITDPPYNVAVNDESDESLKARNRRSDGLTIKNDKMSEQDFNQFLLSVFNNYQIAMTEGASIYVFYADSMTIPFMSTFIEAGFHFAQNCIWNKQQFVMTRKDYHYKHEPVLYGWKKGAAHSWMADRKQSSVWNFDRPFKSELHPTMKPISLIEYPMLNSSSVGSSILDLFGGSGSTLIACEKTNRKCFMMELDPHYCDVIVSRWCKYTGQTKVKRNGEEVVWDV